MGTIVRYNNITLHNVQTRDWIHEVRYDESRTDVLFHAFQMRFEGILHAESPAVAWISADAQGIAPDMPTQSRDVQFGILKPRANLFISTTDENGQEQEQFRCIPAGGVLPNQYASASLMDPDRDVDNGPKPKAFRILQVIGSKALRVSFEIECAKLLCGDPGSQIEYPLPNVLNNRWSVSEDMDENQFVTRTINGKLRLSAAVASSLVDGKWLIVPGLERGFRRTALDFTVDKTGLECEYRVTDRQVHTAAPWPATKMSAVHSQSTNDGLNMFSEMRVELEGPPAADKKLMFLRAIRVIDAKLNLQAVQTGYKTNFFPEEIRFTDYIGDANRIEVTARFKQTPATQPIDEMMASLGQGMGTPLALGEFPGEPWLYDPSLTGPPALYGYNPPRGASASGSNRSPAAALIFQCYLQMPCLDVHGLVKGTVPEPPDPPDVTEYQEPPDGTYHIESPGYDPQPPDNFSDSVKNSIYTFSRSTSRYFINNCRVQLPIAAPPSETPQDTSRVFSLAPGQCRRTIDVDIERVGAWPQVPPPDDTYTDGGLTGRLLSFWVEPLPPSLSVDGVRKIYRVIAHYVYALNRPPLTGEKYRVGVAPQTNHQKDDAATKFDSAIAFANPELGP